jgi:hypothetical protein
MAAPPSMRPGILYLFSCRGVSKRLVIRLSVMDVVFLSKSRGEGRRKESAFPGAATADAGHAGGEKDMSTVPGAIPEYGAL